MAIDFPKDRPEAGLGSGPLQNGDVWTNKSIEYTWVVTPSGVGAWSSRGINVDPEVFIAKVDQFGGDVSGTYDNLTVNSAANADTADQLNNKLTLKFISDTGDVTETIYDGTKAETFTFTDTDDATSVIQLNGGIGIDIQPNNTIAVENGVARRFSGYVIDGDGNNLRVANADNANDSDRLGGTQASEYATKDYVDNNAPGGGTQDLQSVLDQGAEARLTENDRVTISHDNGEINMQPNRQWLVCKSNNGNGGFYKPGSIELKESQPYIDFKRTSSNADYETRISQQGTNLFLDTPFGSLYHRDSNGAVHQIGSGGGGGGGTVIAGVANVNRREQTTNPISVSPTTGDVQIGWNGLTTGQLSDVDTSGVQNGQVLAWNSGVNQWRPVNQSTGSGSGGGESVFPGDKVYTVDTSSDFAGAFESAYNEALSNGGHVFVPGGTHTLSRNVQTNSDSKVHQVAVFGPAYDVAEINCHIYQLWFKHPTNLRDLKIRGATLDAGGGSQWQVPTQNAGARGMILFYRNSDASEEDMDSSILNCDIKVGAMQNGYAIVYRGRNLKMHDCRLTRQKQNSVEGCLRMIYNVTETDEIQGRLGWRRCSINDNTFHAWDESTCITVDFSKNTNGNVNCYGLIVSNNTLENGGTFIQTLGANASERLVACNITDNTMHFIKPLDMPCINIQASNSVITGNTVTLRGRVSGGVAVNGATDSNNINGDSSDNIIHNPKPFNLDNA